MFLARGLVVFFLVMLVIELLLILLPILITGLTQVIKAGIKAVRTQKPNVKDLFQWGGFPSSHAALVSSLATSVIFLRGWNSAEFMIVLAFGIIVLRDAMGLREFVEQHSQAINIMRKNLPADQRKLVPHQVDSVGHSPTEVAGGVVIGVVLTLIIYFLLPV